jgi:hypothetical protein
VTGRADDLLGMIACLRVGIDPRNCHSPESTAREIDYVSGGRGLGSLLDVVGGRRTTPPPATSRAAAPITSLDSLIATGMLPPGLATQIVKVPK